ncbi:MAG: hypothetical protein OXD29_06030 [Roseovarius sp.]|nr:hypothetical protein [Roseovarius sp.]
MNHSVRRGARNHDFPSQSPQVNSLSRQALHACPDREYVLVWPVPSAIHQKICAPFGNAAMEHMLACRAMTVPDGAALGGIGPISACDARRPTRGSGLAVAGQRGFSGQRDIRRFCRWG